MRTQTIAPAGLGSVREFAGEVRARTESRLSFRVGGKLVRRPVDVGDAVKVGRVLAQLDPVDLRLGQDAAGAALTSAIANHEQTVADVKRFKNLHEQGFISAAELERRQTALTAAKAQLEQARVQAGMQSHQAAYATLVADAPGVITGVDAEPGAVVAAGTPVLRLAHDGSRDVVFAVPEDQVSDLRPLAGKPGSLKVKLWGQDADLPATVREVSAAADPVTRTFQVKGDLGEARVRLGQTAVVFMEMPKAMGVTRVPLTAVMEVQGKTSVWLVDKTSMTVKPQPVQVAGAEGNNVLVSSGLQPGQTVVTAGVHVLTPGQKVKFYVERRSDSAVASNAR